MKYEFHYGPSLLIALVLILILGAHAAFADDSKGNRKWEAAPYVGFDFTVHGGVGDSYDGMSAGMGLGMEAILTPSDRFAIGANARTDAVYDAYVEGDVFDEYGLWTVSAGPIVYVGDMFYVTAMAVITLDVFHHDTYLHGDGDKDLKEKDYTVDDTDWRFELGFRVDWHAAVYAAAVTHMVETSANTSKYHIYAGLKFFY